MGRSSTADQLGSKAHPHRCPGSPLARVRRSLRQQPLASAPALRSAALRRPPGHCRAPPAPPQGKAAPPWLRLPAACVGGLYERRGGCSRSLWGLVASSAALRHCAPAASLPVLSPARPARCLSFPPSRVPPVGFVGWPNQRPAGVFSFAACTAPRAETPSLTHPSPRSEPTTCRRKPPLRLCRRGGKPCGRAKKRGNNVAQSNGERPCGLSPLPPPALRRCSRMRSHIHRFINRRNQDVTQLHDQGSR